MKTARLSAALSLLVLASSPALRAAGEDKTSLSVGPAAAWLETPAGDADLAGLAGTVQFHLGKLLLFDTSLRGSYSYLTSTDSTDFERQDSDADLVFSTSLLGFLTPYATAGVSYDRFDAIAYSGDTDWDPGFAVGLGLEVTILPALLSATPAVRYVDADHTDTVTWSLDAQFHFSVVAVGARVAYEDNDTRDGDLTTVAAYAALRF